MSNEIVFRLLDEISSVIDERVSVVIPHYNDCSTISRALDSVFSQTLLPHEVILVDDGSSEAQRKDLKVLLQGYPKTRLVELPTNSGPGSARNRGWDEAKGEWVAFLDSDDAWHPRKLEIQMKAVSNLHMLPSLVACRTLYVDSLSDLSKNPISHQISVRILKLRELLIRNRMSTPSVMLRKDLQLRFREGRRYSEDFELWLSLVGLGYTAVLVDLPLAAIFKAPYGAAGLSSHTLSMIGGEYKAYTGAHHAGAFAWPQLLVGLSISTGKSLLRLSKVFVQRQLGRLK